MLWNSLPSPFYILPLSMLCFSLRLWLHRKWVNSHPKSSIQDGFRQELEFLFEVQLTQENDTISPVSGDWLTESCWFPGNLFFVGVEFSLSFSGQLPNKMFVLRKCKTDRSFSTLCNWTCQDCIDIIFHVHCKEKYCSLRKGLTLTFKTLIISL